MVPIFPYFRSHRGGLHPGGESYYLGAPVHISIPKVISSVRIIQEPPKHLDYLPDESCEHGKPCEWQIVNVSKVDDFYASFEESTTKSIETESTSETDWDIGGSEKVTAKETFKGGIPDIDSGEVTSSQSEQVGYDYNSVTEKLNGHYSSVTCGEEFETSADDALQLKVMLLDIWRYPIYGLKTKEGKNAFYEVVLPGDESYLTISGKGDSDYYQPIHENGNLLSYPMITDTSFPDDLGSFEVEGLSYTEVMTQPHDLSYGDIEETYYVGWADNTWKEKTTTQKKKLSESADFKLGFRGKASQLLAAEKWSVELDVSFHNSNSWSKTAYSKSETKTDGRVTVKVPDGDTGYGYLFRPILYTTTDGTLKLAHTVAPNSTASFWQHHYHKHPDLSLNLPMKYWWDLPDTKQGYGSWFMNATRQERSRMRGLFFYLTDPEKNKGKERYLAGSPTAGDTIYVQAYVYNYALSDPENTDTGPFTVRFSYAPYNSEIENGEPDLTTIGDVTVDNLEARGRKAVSVEWKIAGDLGGDDQGGGKPYVIYVTLDPENEVTNETHELYAEDQSPEPSGTCLVGKNKYSEKCGIFCASNNQGYWPWDNSFMIFAPSQGSEVDVQLPLELRFKPDSLEVGHTSRSEGTGDWIFTDMEYRLKMVIVANRGDGKYRDVLFYDNDKIFSMKRSFGLNPGENDFCCRWTPGEPGEHTLKVEVIQDEDDPKPENNIITLDVEVLDSQIPAHR